MPLKVRPIGTRGKVTIATHNRSSVSRAHNLRQEHVVSKEPHIDTSRVHEVWHDEAPRDAYKRLFGEAMEKYNREQKRADRRIEDYYNAIRDDAKKHVVYEMIIGVYGRDEDGKAICSEAEGKAIMREFVDGWKERNPNLELVGAYYHSDEEGEPHVHIDYVPVAHGYKNGMETQNGLVKALGEIGFEKHGRETAQIAWERCENRALESLCIQRGFEVAHPRIESIEHIDTATFKACKELEKQAEVLSTLETAKNALRGDMELTQGKLEAMRKEELRLSEAIERKKASVKRGFMKVPVTEYESLERDKRSFTEALHERRQAEVLRAKSEQMQAQAHEKLKQVEVQKQELENGFRSLRERENTFEIQLERKAVEVRRDNFEKLRSLCVKTDEGQQILRDFEASQKLKHHHDGFSHSL